MELCLSILLDGSESECAALLYQRQHFADEGGPAAKLAHSLADVRGLRVKSIRVVGPCIWR